MEVKALVDVKCVFVCDCSRVPLCDRQECFRNRQPCGRKAAVGLVWLSLMFIRCNHSRSFSIN